jgi:hypothetical protein
MPRPESTVEIYAAVNQPLQKNVTLADQEPEPLDQQVFYMLKIYLVSEGRHVGED